MKNLIEEIKKALQDTKRLYNHTSEIYNGYLKSHYRGKMEAYMNILDSLKDYNIINAPKKPIYENDLVDENIVVDTWAFCPTCKEELEHNRWGEKYCSYCGQKLDWSDTNE